jgi:hypothetical protein
MGGIGSSPAGEVEVIVHEGGILERRGTGFVTLAAVARAHARCDSILAGDPDLEKLLTDLSALEGFESGLPIASLRWVQHHAGRWTRAAIVIRNAAMAGIAQTFEQLVPGVPHFVTQSREEAWDFLTRGTADAPAARSGARRDATLTTASDDPASQAPDRNTRRV